MSRLKKWSKMLSRLRPFKRLQHVEDLILSTQAELERAGHMNAEILDVVRHVNGKTLNVHMDSLDLREVSRLRAGLSSSRFFDRHMQDAKQFFVLEDFLKYCVDQTTHRDAFLEFGVFSGRSVNIIADRAKDAKVAGFDSFEGLPETWRSGFEQGVFAVAELPEVRSNVTLVKGWFDETLPSFVKTLTAPVGFVHVDCDLYSSTKTIFDILGPYFADEVIVVFDEYFNYPGWEDHEHKAFKEFLSQSDFEHEFIACIPVHQQAAARLRRRQ
ncbi:class I SAM-dependent methyltransferase [Rhodobacteraceae bacterium B1Z28]|uniref:Class I SAM-dependent methyltransferase n=1 Tax=Ruegeria haliotis TaxID=2747601 RepID=A0ABX2PQS6_9RHOB|nr:class I SAM-dependent methyltransferase [Ruegeria haliotis]NVO56470.1 class I SAM-dependent methyltransferase [Ruegeria haliotis]